MKDAYRIIKKNYDGEVIFGIKDAINDFDIKLTEVLRKYRPYKYAIPYWKKSHFAFLSKNALLSFLKFENITAYDLYINGYKIEKLKLEVWSPGLSNFMCTYFDDEVKNSKILEENELDKMLSKKFEKVIPEIAIHSDIESIKERYYSTEIFY